MDQDENWMLSLAPETGALSLPEANALLSRFNLSLSAAQCRALQQCERAALQDNGRVIFGEGALPKLIYALCDSPYIDRENLQPTLEAMVETFYYYKSESDGFLSDDELIQVMADCFNGEAEGSLEYMAETTLTDLIRKERRGE